MKPKKLLTLYNLFVCFLLLISGILTARSAAELLNSLVFFPLVLFFGINLIRQIKLTAIGSAKVKKAKTQILASTPTPLEGVAIKGVRDIDRRAFLKLIGSAGISLFMLALFTKKAEAAFFGSVPGPGTISLKDKAGNKIDPAEKNPTDGYEITQLDDSGSPAYYGFVNNSGSWYIMTEDASGAYRYTKGGNNFSTNWTARASLSYDYYNTIFG